MHFPPKILDNLFSAEDHERLLTLVRSDSYLKSWKDRTRSRQVKKFSDLEEYFSKKLEPLAREIFNDSTLKTSYAAYLDYNQPTSQLDMHRDTNACTYSIDYCITSKTPWGLLIEDEEFILNPGQGLAFMGGYDAHGRGPMPDPENNRVEVVMFHFCPDDHWYFTEGPEYIYTLEDEGKLDDFETYDLSPNKRQK